MLGTQCWWTIKSMLVRVLAKLKFEDKPLIHSDQGWQYQMRYYQEQLVNME